MDIVQKARCIFQKYVCDHCVGRQYAQLLSGYHNLHRGRLIRSLVAMTIDKEKLEPEDQQMDLLNFTGFKFHFLPLDLQSMRAKIKKRRCSVCGDIFKELDKYAERIEKEKRKKKIEFNTFLVGTKLSADLLKNEERLWERAGIDWCEPLKAELNREIGKRIEKRMKKKFDVRQPDVNLIINLSNNRVEIELNPLFIQGEYQKLKRGIPQTKWPDGKYKTSVEEIVAKPFMKKTKGKGHKFHGLGREDIDAKCLAWRPFVLEILEPRRMLKKKDLSVLRKKIGCSVKVRRLRFSDIGYVRRIKEARWEKSYEAVIRCKDRIEKKDIRKLKGLIGEIRQQTPRRVLHRRSDRLRKRRVKKIRVKYINSKRLKLIVRGEAGLYIKELITGDNGRTHPSVSELLNNECECKQLDVVGIHKKKL